MRQIFFSKNCANTETHSFADIYAIGFAMKEKFILYQHDFNWH